MYVILLGPPGAGKGTQAILLAQRLSIPHIYGTDLFREVIASGSTLGHQIDMLIQQGNLLPDQIMVEFIIQRLLLNDCRHDAIIDGIPRTISQAIGLDEELENLGSRIDYVIYMQIPDEVLLQRLGNRWSSRKTGQSFNPATLGQSLDEIRLLLDQDDELYQRPDDAPDKIERRLEVYRNQTLPLVEYYSQRGILHNIDANQPIEWIHGDIINVIKV